MAPRSRLPLLPLLAFLAASSLACDRAPDVSAGKTEDTTTKTHDPATKTGEPIEIEPADTLAPIEPDDSRALQEPALDAKQPGHDRWGCDW